MPYSQTLDPAAAQSCCHAVILAKKRAQSFVTLQRPLAMMICVPRKNQDVTLPLVIFLGMEMVDVSLRARRNERSPKQDYLDRHSSLPDLTQPSVGIQVRAACRQRERLNPT